MSYFMRLRKPLREAASLLIHFAHGGFLVAGIMSTILAAAALGSGGTQAFAVRGESLEGKAPQPEEAEDTEFATERAQATVEQVQVSPETRRVVDYLARKYRVAATAIEPLIAAAHTAGARVGLDPMLIVAVIAVESSFNPFAESPMGAQGLMQVIPRYHQEKLEAVGQVGETTLLDPVTNIQVGAKVLKESIQRSGGLEAGLQYYAGASTDAETQYANKVMAEKQRLEQAARRSRNA